MTPFHIIDLFDDVDDLNSCTGKLFMNLLRPASLKQTHIRGKQVPYVTEEWGKTIRHRN